MDIGNYEGNSDKSKLLKKEKQRKLEPVVKNPVKIRKKSEARRFLDLFIAEDKEDIKGYIFMDVLIPAIKNAIWNVVAGSLEMSLFGGSGKTNRSTGASRISYRSFSENPKPTQRESRVKSSYDYDDIILNSRGEAEDVLMRMDELISAYGIASVGDFYDIVGVDDASYTANNYGWTDIRSASVVRLRDGGYMIKFPKAMPISK